jgi:hypothetical protein
VSARMSLPPARPRPGPPAGTRPRVVVVGAYLTDRPTNVHAVAAELSRSRGYDVRQSWAAVGGERRAPKYVAVNALLRRVDLADMDFLIVCDDDIALPAGFTDRFLHIQSMLGFALAQPARATGTPVDHEIVEAEPGLVGRQTLFVESGPLFSIHHRAFDLLLPFDLTSPMGWGYEYVWAYRIHHARLSMGIVDATPVRHELRAPASNYDPRHAYEGQCRLLARNHHLPIEACHRVLRTFRCLPTFPGAPGTDDPGAGGAGPA